MAYVNYPTYLETAYQGGMGQTPAKPQQIVVQPPQDDTAKTLLFLGVGLAIGYWILKKDKPQHEKNPHEYIEIKSLPALLKAYAKNPDEDDDRALHKAVEAVRVKNPTSLPDIEVEAVRLEPKALEAPSAPKGDLIIVKKIAKGRYFGIYRHDEPRKSYSVELHDLKGKPVSDPDNKTGITSLPKAKAYAKSLKEKN